ncbi:uncharacterized protein [Engystomops pustulosus]|uniref:uncharacterized protein isoform X3 n=1 Tax=Engystomops pustulosus TaxID=76066 RepID=UPI003AFA7605
MKQTPARRKQTATNSLLSFTSFHPKHLRQSIPVGQFLRLRRNCSDIADFRKHAKDLTGRFRARGYPKKTGQELRRRTQQHLSSITTAASDLTKGKTLSTVATHFLQVLHLLYPYLDNTIFIPSDFL